MKKALFYLIILFPFMHLFGQWKPTNGPEGGFVPCIEKIDSKLWAGTIGGLYTSDDEGINWVRDARFTNLITDIHYQDSVIIIVSADNNDSWLTRTSFDKGATWTASVYIPFDFFCTNIKLVKFQDVIVAYDLYSYKPLVMTSNYGLSWSTFPTPFQVNGQNFRTDGNTGLIFSSYPDTVRLYKAEIQDQNWVLIDTTSRIFDAAVVDDVLLLLCQTDTQATIIKKSNDFGLHWDTVYSNSDLDYSFFIYEDGVYYCPTDTSWLESKDKGSTWQISSKKRFGYYEKVKLANGDFLLATDNGLRILNQADSLTDYRSTGITSHYIFCLKSNGNKLYASTGKGLYCSLDEGEHWQQTGAPYGEMTDIEFIGDTIICSTSLPYQNYLYSSYDAGSTWRIDSLPQSGVYAPFSTLCVLDDVIYLAFGKYFKSEDWGKTWQELPPFYDTLTEFPYDKHGTITVHNNKVYALSNIGVMYNYDPLNSTWSIIHEFQTPGAFLGIELYGNGSTLVITGRNIFECSFDEGLTWEKPAMFGLPVPIAPKSMLFYDNIWLATSYSFGVYFSTDSGNNWQPLQAGISPVRASNRGGMVLLNNRLFLGSSYQSVWVFDNISSITGVSDLYIHDNYSIYPNPTTNELFIEHSLEKNGNCSLLIYDLSGKLILKRYSNSHSMREDVSHLESGTYFGVVISD